MNKICTKCNLIKQSKDFHKSKRHKFGIKNECAEYQMKTSIGVAEKLAQVQFPGMMIIGGNGGTGGQTINPFDAVGLESFIRISEKMSKNSKE